MLVRARGLGARGCRPGRPLRLVRRRPGPPAEGRGPAGSSGPGPAPASAKGARSRRARVEKGPRRFAPEGGGDRGAPPGAKRRDPAARRARGGRFFLLVGVRRAPQVLRLQGAVPRAAPLLRPALPPLRRREPRPPDRHRRPARAGAARHRGAREDRIPGGPHALAGGLPGCLPHPLPARRRLPLRGATASPSSARTCDTREGWSGSFGERARGRHSFPAGGSRPRSAPGRAGPGDAPRTGRGSPLVAVPGGAAPPRRMSPSRRAVMRNGAAAFTKKDLEEVGQGRGERAQAARRQGQGRTAIAVEARTTSSAGTTTRVSTRSPSIRPRRMWRQRRPSSAKSWRTVVRGGVK